MRSLLALATGCLALLGVQVGIVFAQAPAPAPERFVLSGVIMFDDGQGIAWLQEPTLTQNRVVARRPGDSVGPWRLTRLLGNRVELEGPAGTVVVPLHNAGTVGADATASAASTRSRRERVSSGEVASEASREPAAAAPEDGGTQSAQVSGSAAGARRMEMLTQMAERGRRDREGRAREQSSAAGTAPEAGPRQFENPNVRSLPRGGALKGGGLAEFFGAR